MLPLYGHESQTICTRGPAFPRLHTRLHHDSSGTAVSQGRIPEKPQLTSRPLHRSRAMANKPKPRGAIPCSDRGPSHTRLAVCLEDTALPSSHLVLSQSIHQSHHITWITWKTAGDAARFALHRLRVVLVVSY